MICSSASFLLPSLPHWPAYTPIPLPGTPAKRTLALLERLGNPHHHLPPVIHVGGTRGKGSTIAFLRAMLEQAGYKVHAYTSPHLEKFNERIILAGREIDDNALFSLIEETRSAAADMQVSFFDGTTAAALLAFSRIPADIVLMEMGLGGNSDATHVIERPLLTILTTISRDHTAIMGNELEEIAAFEAGIMRPGVPCVISYQHEALLPILRARAQSSNTPLYEYGAHWLALKSVNGMVFCDSNGNAQLPLPSLAGAHQIVNAGNAIAAASLMEAFNMEEKHIIAGLMQTQWKGRLQRLYCTRLPAFSELWFDGGHSEAAAGVISHHCSAQWQDKPLYLIFGTSQGKDVASMLTCFTAVAQQIYSVEVKSEPDSYTPEAIQRLAEGIVAIIPQPNMEAALDAICQSVSSPFRVLVFGSLYLWLEANAIK